MTFPSCPQGGDPPTQTRDGSITILDEDDAAPIRSRHPKVDWHLRNSTDDVSVGGEGRDRGRCERVKREGKEGRREETGRKCREKS